VKIIEKIIDIIFIAVKYAIVVLFSILVVLVFVQVFNRFVLNVSVTWSTEIANYSMMWITLLGAAALLRNKGHMAISNVLDALHGIPQKVVTGISVLFQCLFIIGWIYGCIVFLPTVVGQYSPALHLNMVVVDSVFLLTGILMLLSIFDYWIVKGEHVTIYSEEDKLIQQAKEDNQADDSSKKREENEL